MLDVASRLVPRFALLVAVSVMAVLAELAVLVLSARRLRRQAALRRALLAGQDAAAPIPSRAFELVAALLPVVVAALAVASVHTCRRLMLEGMVGTVSEEKAAQVVRAMGGEMHSILLGLLLTTAAVAPAVVAVAFAVAARLRAAGLAHAGMAAESAERAAWLRHPGPAPGRLLAVMGAFVALGLGPLLVCAYRSGGGRISAIGGLVGLERGQRFTLLNQHLEEVARQLRLGLVAGWVGVGIAAAVAVTLLVLGSPSRLRARLLGRPDAHPGRGVTALTAAFAALAAAAVVVSWPLRRENVTPWPPLTEFSGGPRLRIQTLDLTGPDDLVPAPIVEVDAQRIYLNGVPIDEARLEAALWTLRDDERLRHPGTPFDRRLLLACTREVSGPRLGPVLAAALRAGYERPLLTFTRHEVTERPLFGPRHRILATGAAFTLVPDSELAEEGSALVHGQASCAGLGAILTHRRRAGKNIAVVLPR